MAFNNLNSRSRNQQYLPSISTPCRRASLGNLRRLRVSSKRVFEKWVNSKVVADASVTFNASRHSEVNSFVPAEASEATKAATKRRCPSRLIT